jgi:hypothetical protein
MGRTPYTSSTVTHLAHQAGSSSDIYNASSSTAEGSSINKTPLSLNLPTGSSSRVKDTPTVWANKAFDPDDDALPAIEEVSSACPGRHVAHFRSHTQKLIAKTLLLWLVSRLQRFLDPYETVLYNAGVRQRGDNDVDLDYVTDHEEEDDEDEDEDEDDLDDEDDVDDDEEPYQPEDHDHEHYFQARDLGPQPPQTYEDDFVNGEEDADSSTIVELAHAFLSRPPRYQELGEGLSSSEYDDDNQDEDEEPPHGNQGYYDYSYGRGSNQQVVEAPALGGVEGGFSPSTGVFHTHTLPFNLPNMGERQLQRRASNNITSSLGISANNDTFLA